VYQAGFYGRRARTSTHCCFEEVISSGAGGHSMVIVAEVVLEEG